MSYMALYRKYRPRTFEDVKGQDHIVTTLRNQVMTGRVGHAYLFCGTRGTGKTTVAKILAKAVNCEAPVNGEPCGCCGMCTAIAQERSVNVAEIDAASNNGVDNIREIRDEVRYSPAQGKYRVYIIDEVHMLSTGAFNALLKTLEEPPSYVIFILATTEANKIPDTIMSRCQRYDFKRISSPVIAERLTAIAQQEDIQVQPRAIEFIARKGEGSMRDAISIFDQCAAVCNGRLMTYDNVIEVLGCADSAIYSRFLRAVSANDLPACIALIDEIVAGGIDIDRFVQDFIWYMRNLMLLMSADCSEDTLEMTSEDIARLREEAAMTDRGTIFRYIRIFSELYEQIRRQGQKRVALEIAVVRLTTPQMEDDLGSLRERVRMLESKVQELADAGSMQAAAVPLKTAGESAEKPASSGKNKEEPAQVVLPRAQYEDLMTIKENWPRIAAQTGHLEDAFAAAEVVPAAEGHIELVIEDELSRGLAARPEATALLKEYIRDEFGRDIEFTVRGPSGKKQNVRYVSDEMLAAGIDMPVEIED